MIYYTYASGFVILSVVCFILLKEDPIFLFDIGRIKEAKDIIEEIGT